MTARDALDAQVMVEAAHRSATSDRTSVITERAPDDLASYRASCGAAGLLVGLMNRRAALGLDEAIQAASSETGEHDTTDDSHSSG